MIDSSAKPVLSELLPEADDPGHPRGNVSLPFRSIVSRYLFRCKPFVFNAAPAAYLTSFHPVPAGR
jgi:hypothetical protein